MSVVRARYRDQVFRDVQNGMDLGGDDMSFNMLAETPTNSGMQELMAYPPKRCESYAYLHTTPNSCTESYNLLRKKPRNELYDRCLFMTAHKNHSITGVNGICTYCWRFFNVAFVNKTVESLDIATPVGYSRVKRPITIFTMPCFLPGHRQNNSQAAAKEYEAWLRDSMQAISLWEATQEERADLARMISMLAIVLLKSNSSKFVQTEMNVQLWRLAQNYLLDASEISKGYIFMTITNVAKFWEYRNCDWFKNPVAREPKAEKPTKRILSPHIIESIVGNRINYANKEYAIIDENGNVGTRQGTAVTNEADWYSPSDYDFLVKIPLYELDVFTLMIVLALQPIDWMTAVDRTITGHTPNGETISLANIEFVDGEIKMGCGNGVDFSSAERRCTQLICNTFPWSELLDTEPMSTVLTAPWTNPLSHALFDIRKFNNIDVKLEARQGIDTDRLGSFCLDSQMFVRN